MEELGSIWCYQESIDELRMKLQYTTLELESVKIEANEEKRKHKEEVKGLLDLLKFAYTERDEAKTQLEKLYKLISPVTCPTRNELNNITHHPLPQTTTETPLLLPLKPANSSITESNSFSQSHNSSPVESFFDTLSSPDFSNLATESFAQMGFLKNQGGIQDFSFGGIGIGIVHHHKVDHDPVNGVIDNLVKGKSLPKKGKFLQAVMESGPLLQTLLVAGPLPQWRNPPPLQSFKVPPVSINGSFEQSIGNVQMMKQVHNGKTSSCSSVSMLNFGNGCPVSGMNNGGVMLNTGVSFDGQISIGKRQRVSIGSL